MIIHGRTGQATADTVPPRWPFGVCWPLSHWCYELSENFSTCPTTYLEQLLQRCHGVPFGTILTYWGWDWQSSSNKYLHGVLVQGDWCLPALESNISELLFVALSFEMKYIVTSLKIEKFDLFFWTISPFFMVMVKCILVLGTSLELRQKNKVVVEYY